MGYNHQILINAGNATRAPLLHDPTSLFVAAYHSGRAGGQYETPWGEAVDPAPSAPLVTPARRRVAAARGRTAGVGLLRAEGVEPSSGEGEGSAREGSWRV